MLHSIYIGGGILVIYLDILICLNLFVNFFLLKATAFICKADYKFFRLLLSSFFGAISSVTILIPSIPLILDFFIKAVVSLGMVLIGFCANSKKKFLRLYSALLLSSFFFAGGMFALWMIFKPQGMHLSGNAVYFDISPLVLVVSTCVFYFALKLVDFFTGRKTVSNEIFRASITLGNKTISADAFCDTGNHLTDLLSGNSVIVAERSVVASLLPDDFKGDFCSENDFNISAKLKYRIVPYTAIGSKGFLPAFIPDNVKIHQGDKMASLSKVTVAVSESPIHDEYKILLSSEIVDKLR